MDLTWSIEHRAMIVDDNFCTININAHLETYSALAKVISIDT